MLSIGIETPDWTTIPAPTDGGATRHLSGARLVSVGLLATDGSIVDLSALNGRVVVYAYPRTGRPGEANPDGWDLIPGARGCTPQSCGFRDHYAEIKSLGVQHLFGLSTQDSAWQQEAAERLHLPFPILSDEALQLTGAMYLPTFSVAGMTLLKRMALVIQDGMIEHVFYPVFPPDRNAQEVVQWLKSHPAASFDSQNEPGKTR
ncbi:MAG TPA: peroxiredoxin [Terracidiphilus sp.]|nr:peroxiredoxin [Terracidiphilus sp.]